MPDAGVDREPEYLADVDGEKMDETCRMTDRMSALLRDLSEMQLIHALRRNSFNVGGRKCCGGIGG